MAWWMRKTDVEQQEEPSHIELLKNCCSLRTPAGVIVAAHTLVRSGLFNSISDNSVKLDLLGDKETIIRISSLCCVSFHFENKSHVFLAKVIDHHQNPPPDPSHLILQIPTELASEGRMAFRVPAGRASGIGVKVVDQDGREHTADLLDLSMSGMLAEFAQDQVPELLVGDTVDVELQLGEKTAKIRGEVRRRDDRCYGFFFPHTFHKGLIDPPEELRTLVKELEQRLLRSKQH